MRWLILPFALLASLALAGTIEGKGVGVHDGDSLVDRAVRGPLG